MTQIVSVAALALLISLAWALGRPRPRLLRSMDATAVAALNRAQISRPVALPGPAALPGGAPARDALPALPDPAGERQRVLRCWCASLRGDSLLRRRIVRASAASGDPALLPLLRQALHDSDPVVVCTAASALEAFRRRPAAVWIDQAPRNVARMR
jgi:HEAT repeat protein